MGQNLGQHFLEDKETLDDIVKVGDIDDSDTILEVGPGKGALTRELLAKAGKVIAVEKDPGLVKELEELFKKEIETEKLLVIQSDIRDLSATELVGSNPYKLVANIPYYLTGQLIEQTLTSQNQPEKVVLLIQKEVAERILAKDGKESILSLSVKAYGRPEIIKVVPAESFSPPPEVDSAVIKISDINRNFFADISEEDFFTLIKRGFGQKRKKLTNNLDTDPKFSKKQASIALKECNIDTSIRAEKLSLQAWRCLLEKLSTNKN